VYPFTYPPPSLQPPLQHAGWPLVRQQSALAPAYESCPTGDIMIHTQPAILSDIKGYTVPYTIYTIPYISLYVPVIS
jgi:hypothetical protein